MHAFPDRLMHGMRLVCTEAGAAEGIRVVEKISQKGDTYTLLVYPPNVQKMIVEHFVKNNKG